jgi:hypothetical protein
MRQPTAGMSVSEGTLRASQGPLTYSVLRWKSAFSMASAQTERASEQGGERFWCTTPLNLITTSLATRARPTRTVRFPLP